MKIWSRVVKILLRLLIFSVVSPGHSSATNQSTTPSPKKPLITDETEGVTFLKSLDSQATSQCANRALKSWNYASNTTKENSAISEEASVQYGKFWKNMSKEAMSYDWKNFKDGATKRQFMIAEARGVALKDDKLRKYTQLKQYMESTYNSAVVCDFKNKSKCDLSLEPDITEIMRTSRDPVVLKSMWIQWRDQTGLKLRKNYSDLSNIVYEAAIESKFPDAFHFDTRAYESPTLKEDLKLIWEQMTPFYKNLHAYVRLKLRDYYSAKNLTISKTGPIPAHILGNMWGQSWSNIYDIVVPYRKNITDEIDVTRQMGEKEWTAHNMTRAAEEFYVSLGFPKLPEEFWNGSILTKPVGRNIICHASAWDLCNGKDFWIKQCTRVTMDDLIVLHHEMGHIQYYIQYKSLPQLFRDGANPVFHEAIGESIALSVSTPKHLKRIGLLDAVVEDEDADINYLLSMALDKIAFLPFAYLVDMWRWDVFDKVTKPDDYNCAWWKLRTFYQGISPPETRSEKHFDPGAKYHVAANLGYTRYFGSMIMQFQFHKALCLMAKEYDPNNPKKPLHKCDIHGSTDAGKKLMDMLKLGTSVPWPEAMEVLTGQRNMTAEPMLAYFKPLSQWLEDYIKRHNVTVGWKEEKPSCVKGKPNSSSFLIVPYFKSTKYCFLLMSVVIFLR